MRQDEQNDTQYTERKTGKISIACKVSGESYNENERGVDWSDYEGLAQANALTGRAGAALNRCSRSIVCWIERRKGWE